MNDKQICKPCFLIKINKEIFEFDQDIDYEVSVQSPGWKRLKKIKLIETNPLARP